MTDHDPTPVSEEAQKFNEWVRERPQRAAVGQKLRDNGGQLSLFMNFSIRRIWDNGEWWYSLVDCMEALSASPNPRGYWSDIKRKLIKSEGMRDYMYETFVHTLPLPMKDGRMRATDCANEEGLLRIIQSVPSPNAEPFKQWLARVGKMVMDIGQERVQRAQNRAQLDQADRDLHGMVQFRGIVTRDQHAALVDANFAGLYAVAGEEDLLRRRGGYPGSLPDRMGPLEMAANGLQRELTHDHIRSQDLRGEEAITGAAREMGALVRKTLAEAGSQMPEDMPQYPPLPPGEWMSDDHPSRIRWDEDDEVAGNVEGS